MRIVYTVLNGRMAGGQKVCLQIMNAARRRGHDVCLVTPSLGELTETLEHQGIPVFQIPMERTFHFHRALQFARFLRVWRADLVHCHAFIVGAILARLGSAIAGVPTISHCHAHPNFNRNPLVCIAQIALDNATARLGVLVAVSESVKESLAIQGIPPDRVRVIPNGIEVLSYDRAAERNRIVKELDLPFEGAIVGYVGRLSEQKGLRELLQAAAVVCAQIPLAHFLIVGEDHVSGGRYRRELEGAAVRLGLDRRVRFIGFRADAARLMQALNVFVLPSWIEGMPMTILEAMAAARPVVATSVGGVPEIVVDGKTGLLVSPRAPDQLADAITFLIKNPEIAWRMGEAGRERVRQHFGEQRMIDQVMALYEETTRKSRTVRETQMRANVRFYNAPDDSRYGRESQPDAEELIRQIIAGHLRGGEGAVVELGCGRGALQTCHPNYVGMDLSHFALKQFLPGRRRIQADGEAIPLRSGSVDLLFSIATLEHIPRPEKALIEIDRVLKAEGVAVLAPAWFCRWWAARGIAVKSFHELSGADKLIKLMLPILNSIFLRALLALPVRLLGEIEYRLRPKPLPFHYERLKPNLEKMLQSDSDAWSSMDPHAAILYYLSRGYSVLTAPSFWARMTARNAPVVIKKNARCAGAQV